MLKLFRLRTLPIVCLYWCVAASVSAAERHLPAYLVEGSSDSAKPAATASDDAVLPLAPAVVPSGILPVVAPASERLRRTVKPGEPYQPLTLKQKARLQLLSTFQTETLARVAITSGLATWRDSPREWPQNVEAYQWRVADRIGQRLVFKQVQFTVGAMLLGEDPRYFLAEDRGNWSRVKSAFKQTWATRRDNGRWAPAYGTFAGAYAASVVSSRWQPERRQHWDSILTRGSSQIGFQFCNHLVREFLPDIKKAFRR